MRIAGILLASVLLYVGWLCYQAFVHDEPLVINANTTSQLQALRAQAKFTDLPGEDPTSERLRNEQNLNELLDRLIQGIAKNPRKRWVMQQMSPTVDRIYLEDTEARERFIAYLEAIDEILHIQSTNGAFAFKLVFF